MADKIQWLGVSQSDARQAGSKRIKMYWTDADGVERQMTKFDTADQLVHVMSEKDENGRVRYENDAVYRETVKDLLANSGDVTGTDGTRSTSIGKGHMPSDEDMMKGLRRDAAIQAYSYAMEGVGSPDPIVKLNAVTWLQDPANAEIVAEVRGVADHEGKRPFEQFLKNHKAQTGESFKFSVPTENAENATDPDEHTQRANAEGQIISVGGGNDNGN